MSVVLPYFWQNFGLVFLPSLLDIIQQKPLQVNHQYDAQSEKQKREAL
jgi:hypothetical protein